MEKNKAPLLSMNDVSVSYGHVSALKNASLEVYEGEIVVLIGANGAGKTTILETVLGIYKPSSGDIVFLGESIKNNTADKNVRRGMFLVPEGRGVFPSMTVTDNLLLGAHHDLRDSDKKLKLVYDAFPILGQRKSQTAGTLSGGERQMLAIGRALMSSPKFIMIDEPSIGLAPIIVSTIFEIIIKLHREGYTILLSEQNAYKALKCADRGYVLETGNIVLGGSAEKLLNDPGVRSAYIGA